MAQETEFNTVAAKAENATKTYWTQDGGIKVSWMNLDYSEIIAIPVECSVCYITTKETSVDVDDDVSRIIAWSIWKSSKKMMLFFEDQRRSLGVTKVFTYDGGNRWKKVIFTFGPEWSDDYDQGRQDQYREQLTETICNCLTEIHKLRLHTVVLPFFISVPAELGASCYVDALARFDSGEKPEVKGVIKGKTSLEHVIFVSEDPDSFSGKKTKQWAEARVSAFSKGLTGCRYLIEDKQESLRMVLVGKTRVGKSDTGNSILGQTCFAVAQQATPVTNTSCFGKYNRLGYDIQVVDTPGLFEDRTADQKHDIIREILRSTLFTLPGPHVFLLVLNADECFDTVDNEIGLKMQEMFPTNFLRFVMIVFTHVKTKEKLDELLEKSNSVSLKALIEKCDGRVLCIENNLKDPPEECEDEDADVIERITMRKTKKLEDQVHAIIEMAIKLRERNRRENATGESGHAVDYYTDKLCSRCVQVLETSSGSRPLEKIQEAVMEGNQELVKLLEQDDKIRKKAKKRMKWLCCLK